jgi:hypothetical protein
MTWRIYSILEVTTISDSPLFLSLSRDEIPDSPGLKMMKQRPTGGSASIKRRDQLPAQKSWKGKRRAKAQVCYFWIGIFFTTCSNTFQILVTWRMIWRRTSTVKNRCILSSIIKRALHSIGRPSLPVNFKFEKNDIICLLSLKIFKIIRRPYIRKQPRHAVACSCAWGQRWRCAGYQN